MADCWKRRNWLRIDVAEGCEGPKLYGVSRFDYVSNHFVCYPIPLNLVIFWLDKLYTKLCFPDDIFSKDYVRGFHDGMMQNMHTAYEEGYVNGRKQKENPTSIH